MIPRIQTGSSFKGAGLYYLHDKRQDGELERFTDKRVAWTYALNTLEDHPRAVLAEMRQTAFDQPYLKMVSGNRIDGRPTRKSVMTVALAWSPEQEPTRQDMIAAGRSFLEHMGWQDHQCLFVAHNDTKHPHVHLILNRVHPETGMGIDDSWRKRRAHKWSLAFEREQGKIYCVKRLETEARGRTETPSGKNGHVQARHYGEWRADRPTPVRPDDAPGAAEWSALKAEQRAEREAFWKETGQLRRDLRSAVASVVREEFAPEWRAYGAMRDEARLARRAYDNEARRAIRHYAKLGGRQTDAVRKIKDAAKEFRAHQDAELKAARAGIQDEQWARRNELEKVALDKLREERAALYNDILAAHREEKGQLRSELPPGRPRTAQPSRERTTTANQNQAPEPAPHIRSNENAGRDRAPARSNAAGRLEAARPPRGEMTDAMQRAARRLQERQQSLERGGDDRGEGRERGRDRSRDERER